MISTTELIVDLIALSIVLFYCIHKISNLHKKSPLHAEITAITIELLIGINVIRLLLNQIAMNVVYTRALDEKVVDSAYAKYWDDIKSLFTGLQTKRGRANVLQQDEVLENLNAVLNLIHLTIEQARSIKPDCDYVFPDSKELKTMVEELDLKYINLLGSCQHYIEIEHIAKRSTDSILDLTSKK